MKKSLYDELLELEDQAVEAVMQSQPSADGVWEDGVKVGRLEMIREIKRMITRNG